MKNVAHLAGALRASALALMASADALEGVVNINPAAAAPDRWRAIKDLPRHIQPTARRAVHTGAVPGLLVGRVLHIDGPLWDAELERKSTGSTKPAAVAASVPANDDEMDPLDAMIASGKLRKAVSK